MPTDVAHDAGPAAVPEWEDDDRSPQDMTPRRKYMQRLAGLLLLLCLAAPAATAAPFPGMASWFHEEFMHGRPDPYLMRGMLLRAQLNDRPMLGGPGIRRRLPPPLRSRRPPPRREHRDNGEYTSASGLQAPRIKPSEALRLAQRRWPSSIALAVNLRGRVYVVKLKAGSRVLQVLVDARTGRVVR